MSRTIGEQVKSGFRLAGGILSFCASVFLLAYGLDAVLADGHFASSAWLRWLELFLAAVLIPLTMHLWIQFFAGCVAFAFVKAIVIIIAGRDWIPPHLAFSRLEAAEMALFFGATLLWLIRFAKTRPEIADRLAILLYLGSFFGYHNNPHFSIMQGGLALVALFLAWYLSRWKDRKRTAAIVA